MKWSKPEKDKHHIIAFEYEILEKSTNELTYKTERDAQP